MSLETEPLRIKIAFAMWIVVGVILGITMIQTHVNLLVGTFAFVGWLSMMMLSVMWLWQD